MSQQESATIPPFLNKVMSTVIRSPLHGMVSKSIMLITFTGRKSGKTYTTPISYTRKDDLVTAFTHAKWARNLEGGAPVTLTIKNKTLQGQADIISDDKEAIASGLKTHLSQVWVSPIFDFVGEVKLVKLRKQKEIFWCLSAGRP